MEREMIFKALVGSHNYNLNTEKMRNLKTQEEFPASDKDFKVFTFPTFDDLYKGKSYAKSIIGETEDLDIHDVRKLPELFFKANINFLEVLFSKEIVISDELHTYERELIEKILNRKDEIAVMNLPHLWNACGGMYKNKMSLLEKGTEGTQHLVNAFGYDTKQALHAYRVISFIDRFAKNGFKNFAECMKYNESDREFMLDIKHGFFTLENFKNFVTFFHDSRFVTLRETYHNNKPNTELKQEIDSIIMELIRFRIQNSN